MKIDLNLKEGQKGDWKLSQFTVTEAEAAMYCFLYTFNNYPERIITAGTYWRLTKSGYLCMTNAPVEIRNHTQFINKASGNVLIAGLGLGMVVRALLDKGTCEHITVVELSQDVIDLVGPSYNDPRVEIVCCDIFKFKPKMHYDYAWFDIWPDISGDNFPQMKKLHRKFAVHVSNRDSWCYKECRKRHKAVL